MNIQLGERRLILLSLFLGSLLIQGCLSRTPSLKSEGPRVHAEIIVLTSQQADALGVGINGKYRDTVQLANNGEGQDLTNAGGKQLVPKDIIRAPIIRSYQVSRYRDSADPQVLHEAHTIYRIEEDSDWVLTSPVRQVRTTQTP